MSTNKPNERNNEAITTNNTKDAGKNPLTRMHNCISLLMIVHYLIEHECVNFPFSQECMRCRNAAAMIYWKEVLRGRRRSTAMARARRDFLPSCFHSRRRRTFD